MERVWYIRQTDEQGTIFPQLGHGPYTWEEVYKLVSPKYARLVIQHEDQEGQERADHIDWASRKVSDEWPDK